MISTACLTLIGPRGSGKSSVAELLGRRLDLESIDTDQLVCERAGMPIDEIFSTSGETSFRRLERSIILEIEPRGPTIIATGGGAVLDPSSRAHLSNLGPVAWLQARPEVLWQRIQGTQRPPLTNLDPRAEIEAVLAARASIYREMATWTINTESRSLEEVCDELEQLWRDFSDHHLR